MARKRVYSFDKTLPDGRIVSVCIPRMTHLRANITYRCDRACPNCNRACGVAKSNTKEDMSVEQFQKAMSDIASSGMRLTKLILTGGEPSIHPDLVKFSDIAMEYKEKHSPECNVWIGTYHHPTYFHRVEEALSKHKNLGVIGTPKTKPRTHDYAPYVAPMDDIRFGSDHFYRGCHFVASLCGLTVDYRGFWCCPVAPAIARVFNLNLAVPTYDKVSIDSITSQYDQSCRRCGFYTSTRAKGNSEPKSKSWEDALEKYRIKK